MRLLKLLFTGIVLLLTVTTPACFPVYIGPRAFNSNSECVSEERILDNCSGIILEDIGDVYLEYGEKQSIRIETDKRSMQRVKVEKVGHNLVLGFKNSKHYNSDVKYYITLTDLKHLEINGKGSIELSTPFKTKSLSACINGMGDITLQGVCTDLQCNINGAGSVNGFDMESRFCKAEVNGTGTCELFVTKDLDAEISGVGKIVYIGNPEVQSEINGVGFIYRR